MKNDPKYEKLVLDDLKTCFAMPVPSWYQAMGGTSTYIIFNYGASYCICDTHMILYS